MESYLSQNRTTGRRRADFGLQLTEEAPAQRNITVTFLRLLLSRRVLSRVVLWNFAPSLVIAVLVPIRYETFTRLMVTNDQSGSSMVLLSPVAVLAGGLARISLDLVWVRNTWALLVGILGSRTVQDRHATFAGDFILDGETTNDGCTTLNLIVRHDLSVSANGVPTVPIPFAPGKLLLSSAKNATASASSKGGRP